MHAIFVQSPDAIVICNTQGQFVEANDAACALFGVPLKKLLRLTLRDFTHTTLALTPEITAQPPIRQFLLRRFDQTERLVEYTLTSHVARDRHLLILRDVTHRCDSHEAELRRQRQRVELFSEVTLKIRQSLQLKEILETTVTEVQRILQADRVLIYQVMPDGTGKPISEAVLPEYEALLGQEFPEEVFPLEYQKRYAKGRVRAIADVHDPAAGLAECLVEFTEQFGIQAKLIVPILQNLTTPAQDQRSAPQKLWGLLIAHQCRAPRHWVNFELELMQQLADQISIALSQAELLGNLEDIVAARTAELQDVNRSLQQEIYDRKQAEAALRQSEEQLRLITNALPVLIAYVDAAQRYQFNNKAYETWLGLSLDELHGRSLADAWGVDGYESMRPHVEAALAGQVVTYENEIAFHDGSVRTMAVTYIPHLDEHQQVQGFFALTSDISDRKAIERMKDEFISVVSHELRTPLTSLHSALKILATGRLGSLSGDGQQMLEIADENTERLVRLVNNVLDLQRIESGEVTMAKRACNAADLMVQATEAMQAMAQQHQITLVVEPSPVQVWADPDYILQALTNLLSNAIKFSYAGQTVWLTVATQPRSTLEPLCDSCDPAFTAEALFQVRDEGQGIPADKLESIFERFQQIDSSDSRKKGGTGLGLAICRKIIEQHDGAIWADSTLGRGSRFFFSLPAFNP